MSRNIQPSFVPVVTPSTTMQIKQQRKKFDIYRTSADNPLADALSQYYNGEQSQKTHQNYSENNGRQNNFKSWLENLRKETICIKRVKTQNLDTNKRINPFKNFEDYKKNSSFITVSNSSIIEREF